MISTFFGHDSLSSSAALLVALVVGFGFGFSLEQAGFGSSKKLAGIFYFRDMTVLKVMFTAMITAMLGLQLALTVGLIGPDQIYLLPTVYGAQIVGGLIFGIGFVIGAWCPGTAAVGVASGRLDALLFLAGTLFGSVLFNEVYTTVAPLHHWGEAGVKFVWQSVGMSAGVFALVFAGVGVAAFWVSEWIERSVAGTGVYLKSPFLRAFSVALLVVAAAQAILPRSVPAGVVDGDQLAVSETPSDERELLAALEAGADHIEPEEVADRLMAGDASLMLVDIRTPAEFSRFHIGGAVNLSAVELPDYLNACKSGGTIVLYSNGMTHAAQARDALARVGFVEVYLLTDGLDGFMRRVLMPVSLRSAPLSPDLAARVRAWRAFFLGRSDSSGGLKGMPMTKPRPNPE